MSSTYSLMMMASKPHLMMQAVEAVTLIMPAYVEFLVAVSPSLSDADRAKLEAIPRVRIIPGTNNPEEAGEVRYRLLDESIGDWVVNVDDDDLWYFQPVNFSAMADDVGLVSGSTLFLRLAGDMTDKSAYILKRGQPIVKPEQVTRLGGSFWAIRRTAWQSISDKIERGWWYSDWRMAYYLIHFGWRYHFVSQMLGLVRSFNSVYPEGPEWEWRNYSAALAQKLGMQG